MGKIFTRRIVVKMGLFAGAAASSMALIGNRASAGPELQPLDAKEPTAVTLGFIDDASKVDPVANPMFKSGETCANCQQYQGKPGDSRGGCVLFAGKSVPAAGWCKVWRRQL